MLTYRTFQAIYLPWSLVEYFWNGFFGTSLTQANNTELFKAFAIYQQKGLLQSCILFEQPYKSPPLPHLRQKIMILLPRCLRYYYILPFMLLNCITIARSQLFLKVRIVATFMSKPLVLALMFLKVILIHFLTLHSRQNPQTFSSVGSAKTTKGTGKHKINNGPLRAAGILQ